MATENNTIKTKVSLDASQAEQEIAQLNAVASDSTKGLEERIAAKNKQVELQEKLSKQEIASLEQKVKSLKGVKGAEKELERAENKLSKARLKAVKTTGSLTKQQNSLNKSLKGSKGSMNALDGATNGLITRLTMLAANPVVAVLTLLVGAMRLLKEAFTSSEEGQNAWNKLMAVTGTLLGNLLDLVADLAEALYNMAKNPRQAIKDLGDYIKENISNRLEGMLELLPKLGTAIKKAFSGDFAGAAEDAADAIAKVSLGIDGYTQSLKDAKMALGEWADDQAEEAKKSMAVADMRAKADILERKLIVKRSEDLTKIAKLRLKSREEDKFGAQERRDALIEAQGFEDSLIASEKEYLILRRDAQIEENTFSRSNKENKMKEAQAIAAVNNAEAARENIARQVQREITRIDGQIRKEAALRAREAAAEAKRLADIRAAELEEMQRFADEAARIEMEAEARKQAKLAKDLEDIAKVQQAEYDAQVEIDELEIERLQNQGDRTFELELALLVRMRDHELEIFEGTQIEREAIAKRYGVAIGKLQMENVSQSEKADEMMLESGIAAAASMFGVSKEAAIALALIKAPEAISNVWAEAAKKPTLPQVMLHGIGGTAMVIAPIIKSLATIKKTKMKGVPNSGGGGGSISPANIGTTNVSDLSANNAANVNAEAALNDSSSSAAFHNVNGAMAGDIIFQEGQYSDFQDQINFVEGQTNIGDD